MKRFERRVSYKELSAFRGNLYQPIAHWKIYSVYTALIYTTIARPPQRYGLSSIHVPVLSHVRLFIMVSLRLD